MDWVKVFSSAAEARTRLIRDKPQLLILDSRRICLVLRDNRIFAFQDSCPHSGGVLSQGSINYLGEVVCPIHGYCFSIKTGRESGERCRDLETFPVREDDTGFYVGI